MDKVLLIVFDFSLRQLYHGILFSTQIEIVPVSKLSTAVLLLTLERFTAAVIYIVDDDMETEVFLNLRKKHHTFSKIKFVFLTDNKYFKNYISEIDIMLSPTQLPIRDLAEKIKNFL